MTRLGMEKQDNRENDASKYVTQESANFYVGENMG